MTDDLRLLLSRTSRRASRDYRMRLTEFDLSPAQATALLILRDRPGLTLRDLAESLSTDQATTSAMVDRLMSQNLVRRETDPDDRRRARLLLAPEADDIVQRLDDARQATNERILEALGKHEAADLSRILTRLLERLSEASEAVPRS
ncbi:MAG TPA: MarR family transcriptional regulator [Dehalococcoidia bacterium]|nr:MarR family transcriptional regulator [Dehalococcoidia bacterium]